MDRFVISNEDLNEYGFWILSSGVDLKAFFANPVMLYNHDDWDGKEKRAALPIGKWTDISVKDGVISGIPQFDEGDSLGIEVKRKVENGFLNAVSIGVKPIQLSEEPKYMKEGQRRPAVIKSRAKEASFVMFPGNLGAVRLYDEDDNLIKLSANATALDSIIPLLSDQNLSKEMEKIAIALLLNDSATEEEIVQAIKKLNAERNELLFQLAGERGVVTPENKAHYQKLAAADFKTTKELLLSAKPTEQKAEAKKEEEPQSVREIVQELTKLNAGGSSSEKSKEDWTFNDWEEKDPAGLKAIKLSNPEKYQKLAETYQPRHK